MVTIYDDLPTAALSPTKNALRIISDNFATCSKTMAPINKLPESEHQGTPMNCVKCEDGSSLSKVDFSLF